MKKNYDVRVRLSSEEKEKIERKAKSLGMKLSSFMRFISLKARVEVVD